MIFAQIGLCGRGVQSVAVIGSHVPILLQKSVAGFFGQ
jgi:hypothetical protein